MNKFEEVLHPICDLLQKKNNDYGDSFTKLRSEYGELAFLIRLEDKLNRAKTLYKQSAQVTTESLEDSIKDIIGYCALELVYMDSLKTKSIEVMCANHGQVVGAGGNCRECETVIGSADCFTCSPY